MKLAVLIALLLLPAFARADSVCVIFGVKADGSDVCSVMEIDWMPDQSYLLNDDGSTTWDEGTLLYTFVLNPGSHALNNSNLFIGGTPYLMDKNMADAFFLNAANHNL